MIDENGPSAIDQEAAALIEVYFELEEPAERDALLDQISALDSPLVAHFLKTMMEADEDDVVRAAAAAALARRGDPEAIALIESDLSDPEDLYFFEQAVQVLAELRGAAFYDTVAAIWRDPERDGDERREAMLGMEATDRERALADFVAFVSALTDMTALPDDELEVAMMAFVRAEYSAALPALTALCDRIAASDLDAAERAELTGLVQEGIDLLSTSVR